MYYLNCAMHVANISKTILKKACNVFLKFTSGFSVCYSLLTVFTNYRVAAFMIKALNMAHLAFMSQPLSLIVRLRYHFVLIQPDVVFI